MNESGSVSPLHIEHLSSDESSFLSSPLHDEQLLSDPEEYNENLHHNGEKNVYENEDLEKETENECHDEGTVQIFFDTSVQHENIEEPIIGMTFDTFEELYDFYAKYGKKMGFGVCKRSSKKCLTDEEKRYATISCSKFGKSVSKSKNILNPRPISKTNCRAKINAVFAVADKKWYVSKVDLNHNHPFSPSKGRFYRSHRIVNAHVKRRLEVYQRAGVRMNKGFNTFVVEGGGYENISFTEKDCRNYIDKVKRLKFGEGDAEAIQSYFTKVQSMDGDFFYAWELDEENRLKSLFWADARSRAAYEEFGDVVTFDTTYLTNKYEMPMAPFVGVNHHGQSILLGCGLIANEDITTFTWLFNGNIIKKPLDQFLEYEVIEDINVNGNIIKKPFVVLFKKGDSEEECEVRCICRLFEFRGMLCRHALTVLINENIYSMPKKYILRRWRKDVKRRHTKVKVTYSDWSTSDEGRRYTRMCSAFSQVADLASELEEKCSLVLDRVTQLEREMLSSLSPFEI